MIPLLFVIAVTVATILLGVLATRGAKTASDFFVAGRSVGVGMNASAISGEYLSAASFMGVAGLVMKNGYDALWYPVGYAAGYLFLLLFIAGPLRRFGAYTIPDFAQGRFDSLTFRKIAVTFVLCIGFFYTMPQMKGAGVTMSAILNWPYWVGILVVGTVITFNVAIGGMKGITLVQAFQYWAKVFAIAAPIFVLGNIYGPYNQNVEANFSPLNKPSVMVDTPIRMKGETAKPANAMVFTHPSTYLDLPKGAKIRVSTNHDGDPRWQNLKWSAEPFLFLNGSAEPMPLSRGEIHDLPPGRIRIRGIVTRDTSNLANEDVRALPSKSKVEFIEPAEVILPRNSPPPNMPENDQWLNAFGPMTGKYGNPLLYTYSLIIALVCGTAGLPHILVRFYTNPDGRSAKRTTLWVMALLGAFYVFTPVWGAMGRWHMPQLYGSNATDAVVIRLPMTIDNELLGQILSGITSAGAFAAFMSTFSGLLVSMSGAFAHDIYGRILRPEASAASRMTAFKVAAVVVGAVSMALGLLVESFDIAMMVGWAFAIGAASYFPLLLLGSWWRGLTKYGAASGMLLGGILSVGAIVASMLMDKNVIPTSVPPTMRTLLEQPAIWAVPLSLGTMWLVSKLTADRVPPDADSKMLRLHAPEELGLSKDYVA